MEEFVARVWENLTTRVEGPMWFRFILQPLMAIVLASRDGVKDARAGKAPWLWAVSSDPEHRRDLLRNGWKSVSKVFFAAIVLDAVFQLVVIRRDLIERFYPAEAVLVACLLALVPYALTRGPVNRLTRGQMEKS